MSRRPRKVCSGEKGRLYDEMQASVKIHGTVREGGKKVMDKAQYTNMLNELHTNLSAFMHFVKHHGKHSVDFRLSLGFLGTAAFYAISTNYRKPITIRGIIRSIEYAIGEYCRHCGMQNIHSEHGETIGLLVTAFVTSTLVEKFTNTHDGGMRLVAEELKEHVKTNGEEEASSAHEAVKGLSQSTKKITISPSSKSKSTTIVVKKGTKIPSSKSSKRVVAAIARA